jgi:plasmid stabilization system protein ParE
VARLSARGRGVSRVMPCTTRCRRPGSPQKPQPATGIGDSERAPSASVSLPVRTTPEADAQIRDIDDWWRDNRPVAPDLFLDELTTSFDIIRHAPQIGRLCRRSRVRGTRRFLRRDAISRLRRSAG